MKHRHINNPKPKVSNSKECNTGICPQCGSALEVSGMMVSCSIPMREDGEYNDRDSKDWVVDEIWLACTKCDYSRDTLEYFPECQG